MRFFDDDIMDDAEYEDIISPTTLFSSEKEVKDFIKKGSKGEGGCPSII